MTIARTPRRSRSQWRRLMADYEASGQSQQTFCRDHGVALSTFARWRRILAGQTAPMAAEPRGEPERLFTELTVPSPGRVLDDTPPWEVGLALGAGMDATHPPGRSMLRPLPRLWLCTVATDMRRQFDGLAAMVKHQLGGDPLSGQGFVFINRRRTQLKCLYFDDGGYCLWSKRLERGQFARLEPTGEGKRALSRTEFEALIEGLDLAIKKRRKRWTKGPIQGSAMIV